MKKMLLPLLLVVVSTFSLTAQSDKEAIKSALTSYITAVESKNYAQVVDGIYPDVFEFLPKEKMLAAFTRMDADTSVIINMKNSTIKNISEVVEFNQVRYALVDYSFTLFMTFREEPEEIDIEEEGEVYSQADLSYEMFKERYGDKNVTLDSKSNTVTIHITNSLYAILNPKYEKWAFIENKENANEIIERIIPKQVVKKLK